MEKFGIFELLDALSAFSAPQSGETDDKKADSADGIAPQKDAPAAAETPSSQRDALASFLARHETISKKIDKNK